MLKLLRVLARFAPPPYRTIAYLAIPLIEKILEHPEMADAFKDRSDTTPDQDHKDFTDWNPFKPYWED